MKGKYIMELFILTDNWTSVILGALSGFTAFLTFLNYRRINKVEKNTDGLVKHLIESKNQEIKTTGDLQKEVGKAEATAEAKIEIDDLNKKSIPKDLPNKE